MKTVNEIYERLDGLFPESLRSEWDNDGRMCVPDGDARVSRVLLALDATDAVIDRAESGKYDLIVTHHPLLFRPLKEVTGDGAVSARVVRLIRSGIAAISFHTRLDAARGGVNDALAELLGMEDVRPFGPDGEQTGRIGRVPETDLETFGAGVKALLDTPAVFTADAGKRVRTVAVLGGSGADFIPDAIAAGADTFLTGEPKYNAMIDAAHAGLNVLAAGHFYTEYPVLFSLRRILLELDPDLTADVLKCPTVGFL